MSTYSSGYRKKPLWVYVVAALFMLTPFGNLLYSLASLGIPKWYSPEVWAFWVGYVTPTTWALLGLIFASGVALLFVRKGTLLFTLGVLALITIYNIAMIQQFSVMGKAAVALMILGTIGAGLALYFTEFRKPYENPRLRWWETSPRYKADLPVTVGDNNVDGILVDISRSGMMVDFKDPAKVPAVTDFVHVVLPGDLKAYCRVARKVGSGLGLQFHEPSRQTVKAIKGFLKQLAQDPSKVVR